MWYLRRIVSADGYKLDPNNVKVVTDLVKLEPKTVGDVTPVQRMVGYFRRYIPGFSKTADPLYQLLKKGGNMNTTSKTLITENDDHINHFENK